MRFPLLATTLALAVVAGACDDGSPSEKPDSQNANPPEGRADASNEVEGGSDSVPEAAATGTKVFQRDAEAIARDLKRLEEQGRPADAEALSKFEGEVRMRIRHIDSTLTALEVSIQAEARQSVQQAHALLRGREGEIRKKMDDLHRERTEVQRTLADHKKNGTTLPPGFTVDELNDRIKDLDKQMAKQQEDLDAVLAELEKKIELLERDTVPEQGTTVLTNERDVYQALRERATQLLDG